MIEVEKARNGLPILKSEGRLTASSFDPVREARTWAENLRPQLEKTETLIVIGVASGYHLAAVKELCPGTKLFGIERSTQVTDFALQWNPSLMPEEIVIAEKMEDLISWPHLRKALRTAYVLVTHGPTQHSEASWCSEMQDFFAARTPEAFRLHLSLRPELAELLKGEALETLPNELLSIKNLQKLFAPLAPCTTERRLWHVLEELVV